MPKVVDHAARRAELVDAAWRVIADEGLEAATMRRIAEVAGCTTGRVTHYFDSKEDVLVAALREVHRRAGQRMIRHIRGADLLGVLLEALPVDEDRRLEWKVWLAFWGRAAADQRLRSEQERRYAQWRGLLDRLVRRARPGGTAEERCTAVDLIASAIDGLGIQAVLEPASFTDARLRRAADAIVDSVLRLPGWHYERMEETIGSFAALGDSFTEGLNDARPDGIFVGWADRTAEVLAARTSDFRYANLAVRGKLLQHVLDEQIEPAIAMSPDLVSVAAGGNDILRRADVDDLAALFDTGVVRLRAAGCRVMIFTGFDPRAFPVIRMLRGRIAAYNMHLRAIADERGCDLVDLWSMRVLCDPRAWSEDRLHLTADAHRRVALRACEVLGMRPADDWRAPLPAAVRQPWLTARREDARWAREYMLPWVNRRLRNTSTGAAIAPKRPELRPVR